MTNNAQLLPLPELSDDDLELLHYNPNTSDVVEFLHHYAKSYALSCIEAAKPAEPCAGKNCGSTDHRFHSADCFDEYESTVKGDGGLPVVAKVKIEDGTWMNVYEPDFTMMSDGMHSLTDHAQATAEIDRRDQKVLLVQHQYDVMKAFNQAAAMEIDTIRAKLAGVDGLAESLKDVMSWISNWTPNFIHDPEWDDSRERAVLALATYEAAQAENSQAK